MRGPLLAAIAVVMWIAIGYFGLGAVHAYREVQQLRAPGPPTHLRLSRDRVTYGSVEAGVGTHDGGSMIFTGDIRPNLDNVYRWDGGSWAAVGFGCAGGYHIIYLKGGARVECVDGGYVYFKPDGGVCL